MTTAPSLITQAVTSTNAAGQVYTVTQIVHNPTSGASSSSSTKGGSSFLSNSGAVAGTFVALGLLATGGVLAFVFFMLKRRRRQRLDRDVAAAAYAAHHSRDAFDDDDEKPAMNNHNYASTSLDTHGQPQTDMNRYDYEDPSGGYDAYAANLAANNRASTATAAGFAGFGAQAAQHDYQPRGYNNGYEDVAQPYTDHNPAHDNQQQGGYYFDPKQAYDYSEEDAYGGYGEEERPTRHHRSGSEGSVANGDGAGRGLKVTNV